MRCLHGNESWVEVQFNLDCSAPLLRQDSGDWCTCYAMHSVLLNKWENNLLRPICRLLFRPHTWCTGGFPPPFLCWTNSELLPEGKHIYWSAQPTCAPMWATTWSAREKLKTWRRVQTLHFANNGVAMRRSDKMWQSTDTRLALKKKKKKPYKTRWWRYYTK